MPELYDKRGIPIKRGDIVKVYHFTGARRKRHYMYKQCLGIGTYRQGGAEYVFFSHLNFVTETAERDGPYPVAPDGSILATYEIVQSIDCAFEDRPRKALAASGEAQQHE